MASRCLAFDIVSGTCSIALGFLCRKTKPVRDIEAVLQKEEDLQRLEEMGNAKAVAAEAAADVRTGSKMMHVTPGQLALPVGTCAPQKKCCKCVMNTVMVMFRIWQAPASTILELRSMSTSKQNFEQIL